MGCDGTENKHVRWGGDGKAKSSEVLRSMQISVSSFAKVCKSGLHHPAIWNTFSYPAKMKKTTPTLGPNFSEEFEPDHAPVSRPIAHHVRNCEKFF